MFISSLFINSTFCFSQPIFKIDSLKKSIENAQGKEKLELLHNLCLAEKNSKGLLDASNMFYKEAVKQNNIEYIAKSYNFKSRYYIYDRNPDSALYYVKLAANLYEKHNLDAVEYYYAIIHSYVMRGWYDLAIYRINELLEKEQGPNQQINMQRSIMAYNIMGSAYLHSFRFKEAIKWYQKALEKYDEMDGYDPTSKIVLYHSISIASVFLHDYSAALDACHTIDKILEEAKGRLPQETINFYIFILNEQYSNIYIGLNDASKAKFYLNELLKTPTSDEFEDIKQAQNYAQSQYYTLTGEYQLALKYLEYVIQYDKDTEYLFNYLVLTQEKVNILQKAGKNVEALHLLQSLTQFKDSVNQTDTQFQLSEIIKSYETKNIKLEMENDKMKLEQRTTSLIALLIIILLLSIILYITKRSGNILKNKNKILYKQYIDLDKYTSQIKEYVVLENELQPSDDTDPLFSKLEDYLQKSEAFTDPDLTRESLAIELNTNRQYLADAIKEATGNTFLDYINKHRVQFARKLLLQNTTDTIEAILFDAGFSSKSTFYRLFKEEYGMTPHEFREAAQKFKSDIAT